MDINEDPVECFNREKNERIRIYGGDDEFKALSSRWFMESMRRNYVYNFTWLGRPIIQNPVDIMAVQEIIWTVKPDLIIETGIAHGGSLIFSASMLELLSACGEGDGEVVGVDIDIRQHNRQAIESHPLSKRISMIEGSSIEGDIVAAVRTKAMGKKRILVMLDSNHTHDHVMAELDAYAPLVAIGSYCVVFDTFVEEMPQGFYQDRPWDKGNNPMTAVMAWLHNHSEFEVDDNIVNKLFLTAAPGGYLKRVK
jgi:cephalosporin hydroxylase